MKKTKRKSGAARKLYGKGAIRYSLPEGEKGPLQMHIDYTQAPVPEAYYYADAVSLDRDDDLGVAILSFGRREEGSAKLRERLDMVLPQAALFNLFWNSSRGVEQTVDQQVRRLPRKGIFEAVPTEVTPRGTLYANNIFVSTAGAESCLDFYYLSPRAIHIARTHHTDIGFQPIIRIILPAVLLKYLFELLRPQAEQSRTADRSNRRTERATIP